MTRFDRQEQIQGWDQQRLADALVVVAGRGWLGTFLVWALCSLGIGRVLWVGSGTAWTDPIARWLLSDPCPIEGSSIIELPFDPRYDVGLEWGISQAGGSPSVCIDTTDNDHYRTVLQRVFARMGAVRLEGGTTDGGWVGESDRTPGPAEPGALDDPVVAMAVAALLADGARAVICPLPDDIPYEGEILGWNASHMAAHGRGPALLVGCGGIGVWAATLLAILGHELFVADGDMVELSNLPRQSLFTVDDAAQQRNKAVAAAHNLRRLVPGARITAFPQRIDRGFSCTIRELQPAAILSAVDNADSRLGFQDLGNELDIPVAQAGTDVFCADCFTQLPSGPSLDHQMHGILSAEAAQEFVNQAGRGACSTEPSWIVPGMLAGAMLVRRFTQLVRDDDSRVFPPMRWRQGDSPREL